MAFPPVASHALGASACGSSRRHASLSGRRARNDLDLTESALRIWVERARADRTQGKTGLTTEERQELARLRKEVRELRMEWEIQKKPRPFSVGYTEMAAARPVGAAVSPLAPTVRPR